jgi:hypothetical protein
LIFLLGKFMLVPKIMKDGGCANGISNKRRRKRRLETGRGQVDISANVGWVEMGGSV